MQHSTPQPNDEDDAFWLLRKDELVEVHSSKRPVLGRSEHKGFGNVLTPLSPNLPPAKEPSPVNPNSRWLHCEALRFSSSSDRRCSSSPCPVPSSEVGSVDDRECSPVFVETGVIEDGNPPLPSCVDAGCQTDFAVEGAVASTQTAELIPEEKEKMKSANACCAAM